MQVKPQLPTDYLPRAYQTIDPASRRATAPQSPHNIFIEVTNHCNLLCETCPRTFTSYEEPKTLAWDDFLSIVAQFPNMERAVLHGIGEPLLNKDLPRMVAHLKSLGVYVLFNTNATLLNDEWARNLIEAGLDELRVSIDGADPRTYALIRGAPLFHKVLANLKHFIEIQKELGDSHTRSSLWMTGVKENIGELPEVVRIAARLGVPEVYLQRMTYYAGEPDAPGMMDGSHAVYGGYEAWVETVLAQSEALALELDVTLRGAGATTAQHSIESRHEARPWAACLRPWTTAYITANGNALPCCLSPFATTDYESLKLGNVFDQPFGDLWNAERYQEWRTQLLSGAPPKACSGCGVFWSL